MCSAVTGGASAPESPEPGRSGTTSWKCSDSAAILRIQCIQLPVPPCSSTSGVPEPHMRQTISPATLVVVCRVLARSSEAMISAGAGGVVVMTFVP